MTLAFIKPTPVQDFRKLERDLKLVDVDLTRFKSMTPRQLTKVIESLQARERRVIQETSYASWLSDDAFGINKMLQEALEFLREYKIEKQSQEVLVPGFSYYRGIKQFGDTLQGKRCFFSESTQDNWIEWDCKKSIAKAMELLNNGTSEDFRRIYVEMADGRPDALTNVSLEHITESTDSALNEIEKYCDSRWEGAWPWDIPSPYTLRNIIEDNREMRFSQIEEMKGRFETLLRKVNEGEMDKFEVVLAAKEIASKIQGMIEDLGKISGEGLLTLKDNTRSALGDEAASQLDALSEPINAAADTLSQLRAQMESAVTNLEGSTGAGDVGGAPVPGGDLGVPGGDLGAAPGGDLGTPADALGEPPAPDLGGETSDELADVDLGGEESERPKKEI